MENFSLKRVEGLPKRGLRLLAECGLVERPINSITRRRIRTAFQNYQIVLAAECSEERLIGIVGTLTDRASYCFVCTLAVLPPWQKKGVGSSLLQEVHAVASEQNYVNLVLHSTLTARAFYEKIGMFPAEGFMSIPRIT